MAAPSPNHDERLRELRERLYSRGTPPKQTERKTLPDTAHPVSNSWNEMPEAAAARPAEPLPPVVRTPLVPMARSQRGYRRTLIVVGLVFFVVALILSGSYLLVGKNMISGDNIAVTSKGPFAVGGGEEYPVQISITNQNAVPIEAATLIIEYPLGTQSADEAGKELVRERRQLDPIKPGETVNLDSRARVFGEENEDKTVLVSIEYRVKGSNATFYKEAEPLHFKISSSPVVLSVENVTKGASGQNVDFDFTVSSNSPTPLTNVLVKAEYPFGFDYSDSDPKPVSGRDTWSIAKIDPSQKQVIHVHGVLSGGQSDTRTFKVSVGVPNERDPYSLASIYTTQTEEITVENPFLDVKIGVNASYDGDAAIAPGASANIGVVITNTLQTTVYDAKISVDLSGNGLSDSQVKSPTGFFDSSTGIVSWTSQDLADLKAIPPGRSVSANFVLTPKSSTDRTPQISMTASVEANRVLENQAQQKLTGTAKKSIKVESVTALAVKALYSGSEFTNTGPIPPKAEEVTTYSIAMNVKNGTNAITDGMVTVTLPQYVTWLDLNTSPTNFAYNPQNRQVSWKVGDLGAGDSRAAEFQVSVKPSESQAGQVINILNNQQFRATDRFTGTVIGDESQPITTQLFEDPEHAKEDGRVVSKDD